MVPKLYELGSCARLNVTLRKKENGWMRGRGRRAEEARNLKRPLPRSKDVLKNSLIDTGFEMGVPSF